MEIAPQAVHDGRLDYHLLSADCEVAENDLNEGLGCIRALVGVTAFGGGLPLARRPTTTSSLSRRRIPPSW